MLCIDFQRHISHYADAAHESLKIGTRMTSFWVALHNMVLALFIQWHNDSNGSGNVDRFVFVL